MSTKLIAVIGLGLLALSPLLQAQQPTPPSTKEQEAENIVKGLKYQQGVINLENGLATLNVPPEFSYLSASDAQAVLVKVWNNPPSTAEGVLGMIMPAGKTPLDEGGWAVTISYANDGYVKDDDASKIDYNAELKKMQQAIQENNKKRIDSGYVPFTLIGWAAAPHYDAGTHKLYWAKELKFGDESFNTLNYDIRILGRRGVLVLSAIARMDQLSEIEQVNPKILDMVNFNDGNRYADFDPKVDKVAEYGIAALVAGGIAAKLGLFKIVIAFLAGAWKLVAAGCVALAGGIKKLFNKNKTA